MAAQTAGDNGIISLPLPLAQTLAATALLLRPARDPWWIISSAAAVVHGAPSITAADVDVLLTLGDARVIFPLIGLSPEPGTPSDRFRSDVFATWQGAPLPVDLMAGFHHCWHDGWSPVQPCTRQPVDVGGVTIFVPDRAELIIMFERFGRPKDLDRARLLASLSGAPAS